ncbi:glycoside hydrolase family 5 protein [Postia placenta MAD-698-R-SB12]|uniref:Glycoside hydrolase family 5 protein n=1 Tax=Postia placenta MAD-698-R-SB12 TaxID=670580 RepID=A0A1X6MIM7_9APHY|nr:glycoside hydrolase family 5 protein [Postia placenta MAD-698-R-SB12]OSX56297.1 glycoside hydrolase family 5 protein [Postia placenta MAD-698-R-SB12]
MPRVPSVSPATGTAVPPYFIHTIESSFVDNAGRTLLLRGVNLSGADKAPAGKPSYILDDFWESGESGEGSFIGRPLNLEDGSADVHLARLRGWGYNMLRYVVTWEALEHAGPGQLDDEFMDYTVQVLRKCKEYGFKVYMDPHQDIWSRFSGGSGAPYWTLPASGLNARHFTPTQAAIVHCEYPTASEPDPVNFPAMIWGTNYGRLASQTLFTLFFAGRVFAPKCVIDGQNIQDYLQSHYIAAFSALADRIRDAGDLLDECVIGWDSMNEPYEGFCGYDDLNTVPTKQTSTLKKGTFPTPAQSFRLGMGRAQTVDNWKFGSMGPSRDGSVTIDPRGLKVWADPESEPDGVHPRWGWRRDPGWQLGTCIWAQHGVWDVETGDVLVPDYFKTPPFVTNHSAHFIETYWLPHWQAFATRLRQSHPESIMFVAPPVFAQPPAIGEELLRGRCCYSAHYYDGLTLITRHWNWFNADALGLLRGKYSSTLPAVKIGESAIRKSLQEQLGILKDDAPILGPYPTIIGEIGIPYDMDGKRSYGYTDGGKYKGDYSSQQKALDASLNAADGPNALNYTIWNYCPDNSHQWGDGWNMEDLSLWSPEDLRPRSDYKMELGGASSTGLLKKDVIVTTRSATTSALSLSTLADAPEGSSDGTLTPSREIASFSRWENAYDFLTDGSRAAKAFCRPYPVAVVGAPKDIQFNLAKAEFKCTVLVRAEDALRPQGISASADDGLATEIYIPLVHYASDSLVARFSDREQECDGAATMTPEGSLSKDSSPSVSRNASSAQLAIPSAPSGSASLSRLFDSASEQLSVKVSAGRWEVSGQILKWWYPIPAPGEPECEYTIVVTRQGGAITTMEEAAIARRGLWERWCSMLRECCCVLM